MAIVQLYSIFHMSFIRTNKKEWQYNFYSLLHNIIEGTFAAFAFTPIFAWRSFFEITYYLRKQVASFDVFPCIGYRIYYSKKFRNSKNNCLVVPCHFFYLFYLTSDGMINSEFNHFFYRRKKHEWHVDPLFL